MELGKKLFIVIVEDDADDRFLFQTAFDENGFKDDLLYIENGYEWALKQTYTALKEEWIQFFNK